MTVHVFGEGMLELSAIRRDTARFAYGGDTLNTAIHLARLNIDTEFVSALGDDAFSARLRAAWSGEGVRLDHCLAVAGGKPGLYAISVNAAGERSFTYWRAESAARGFFRHPGAARAIAAMERAPLLYLSGITLSIFDDADRDRIGAVMAAVRRNGGDVAFDLNYRPRGWASPAGARAAVEATRASVSIAFLSMEDLVLLYGGADAPAAAAGWRAAGCREVVVKDGARGCYLATQEHEGWIAPGRALTPVDTTGAGDSFNAAYLAARRRGLSPAQSCTAGNALAAEVVMHPGAIPPKPTPP